MQGEVTFTSYRATLNEAIIAMFTGANVPQFWMPAFNQQRISALVFMGELRNSSTTTLSPLPVLATSWKDLLISAACQWTTCARKSSSHLTYLRSLNHLSTEQLSIPHVYQSD
jgi:hypothetical protein